MLAIAVNDRPLNSAAIVERGRVLLPVRATFDALGATVTYTPDGTIVARSGLHSVRLRIGQRVAQADGGSMELDVAPRVVAARTYVPLRFVAQSMGAVVGYDASAQLVTVSTPRVTSSTRVTGLTPAQDAAVGNAYPTISAALSGAAAAQGEISLTVDGTDVTSLAAFDGTTITYMPRAGLTRGMHTVVFAGHTLAGEPFSAQWNFATSAAAPPDASAFEPEDFRFYASGPATYYAGDWMHFVLLAPPNGSAELQLCGFGSYPLTGNSGGMMYTVSLPAPANVWMPYCQVTAVYRAWNGKRTYVPVPFAIGIYTRRTATPEPHSTSRPLPAEPRKTPEPIAAPKPPVQTAPPQTPPPERRLPIPPRPRRTPIP